MQIAVPSSIALYVATAIPEALVVALDERRGEIVRRAASRILEQAESADAVVLGPGMAATQSAPLICDVLKKLQKPVVLDAGGLSACPLAGDLRGLAVLTPHAGEMATLLHRKRGEIEADPRHFAGLAAQQFNAVVALKGRQTHIATPQGRHFVNREGHVGLATSGSGDALAGVIAGILARGVDFPAATAWGVYLHASAGRALGRRMGVGFLAHELLAEIPPVMKRLSARN